MNTKTALQASHQLQPTLLLQPLPQPLSAILYLVHQLRTYSTMASPPGRPLSYPLVRPPPRWPPPCDNLRCLPTVCIRHPGYEHVDNVLFTFPATDCVVSPSTQSRTSGLHHQTALTAAAIIANNAFGNVYFSYERYGEKPVKTPLNGILEPGDYFLQLRGYEPTKPIATSSIACTSTAQSSSPASIYTSIDNDVRCKYPIVPSFTDWQFPHNKVPPE
ncbi:hypothetical protein F4803DRAFT_232794 [Xylaria telfairii]|nr:hypothetical protein F4803DRAFT_232794 [Xylaria telfairii]